MIFTIIGFQGCYPLVPRGCKPYSEGLAALTAGKGSQPWHEEDFRMLTDTPKETVQVLIDILLKEGIITKQAIMKKGGEWLAF